MSTRTLAAWSLLVLLFTVGGCFGCLGGSGDDGETAPASADEGDGSPEATDETPSLGDALNEAQEALEQATEGAAEPVDFRKLKDLLPEELDEMPRVNAEGQKSGAFGIKVSQAEGQYEGDAGQLKIAIIDLGTLQSLGRMGYAFWLNAELDRESDSGYERTTRYAGYPAYEKVERMGDRVSCTFSIFVGDRALVNIEGSVDEASRCEDAREELDYDDLEDLVTAE